MNVNVATQGSILRRSRFVSDRSNNPVTLRASDQTIAQAALGVLYIWITYAQRQVKSTSWVLGEDVELAFRGCGDRPDAACRQRG